MAPRTSHPFCEELLKQAVAVERGEAVVQVAEHDRVDRCAFQVSCGAASPYSGFCTVCVQHLSHGTVRFAVTVSPSVERIR